MLNGGKNKKKKISRIHYDSLAWNILKAVGLGAIVLTMFMAPNMGKVFGPLLDDVPERNWRRDKVREAIQRLRRGRYVKLVYRGGEQYLAITEWGNERLSQFDFDGLKPPKKPWRWDKKWRMVIFDIPERRKRERRAFRDKLDEIGLLPLQKSVFIHPHPCEDEIDFLCQFLNISRFVHYVEAKHLGNAEIKARKHFELL